ncbi:F-box/LRR-repeat protein 6 isoform X2 [Hyla sarda]|uniref:F-box/LRR-repeat protein 6 isoform X2 n=1 Tax=Hyla sarda TaxID=327740 RepID=UPI0024C426C6|nr:F-box/LRR-repeat protein 6 isoform X2 [Hyla sarda]
MASSSSQGCRAGKRAKKPGKKRRLQRAPKEDYFIQHTDKDMLLLIPNELRETVRVVKRVRRTEEDAGGPITADYGWGSLMPREIIHRIFQLVVGSEGAVPTLCRLAQVCHLWHQVAYSPDLWHQVSVSRCWILPTNNDPPNVQNKVKKTIETLIQQRLSQVCDFSIHHWKNHIPLVLQSLSSSCPLLSSLTLGHCSKVTVDALESVGHHCPHLTSLNLQNCKVDPNAVSRFLSIRGTTLRCLYLTFSSQTNNIFSLLAVMRLLNVIFSLKSKMSSSPESPGFSHLRELCLATTSFSLISDSMCKRLLRGCARLRVLDLRGCYTVTPEGICDLPCTDLECLYLGMYYNEDTFRPILPHTGCCLLIKRWRHSLQELDLTGLNFSDCELSEALGILCGGGTNDTLQSLSLTGTKVTAAAVRDLLSSCRALTYLDLTSCRNVPRGLKCAYRGVENIRQCLQTLSSRMVEEESRA